MITIGILIFDDAEELDFVGPYEVFTMARALVEREKLSLGPFEVLLISPAGKTVKCAKGMRVEPHRVMEDVASLDVVLVPGGQGTRREVDNRAMLSWIANIARGCQWVTSVCTGSFLLAAAGPAHGKRVTTHWASIELLRGRKEAGEVLENVRYVCDGNVVTSAGVSAGIDMALWVLGQMTSPAFARKVQRAMEYDPAPPYAAEV
ncbi:MAG: DJ-1/PfpI family protein [Alphaproteobacteria bacterium]